MWYYIILQSRRHEDYYVRTTTNDLHVELMRHSRGNVPETAARAPYKLVYYEAYLSQQAARHRELSVRTSHNVLHPLMRRVEESMEELIPLPVSE